MSHRVCRNWCLRQIPAITRLSAIALDLKEEGVNFKTRQHKNPNDFEYVLLDKPKSVEVYTIKGGNDDGTDKVIKKLIW